MILLEQGNPGGQVNPNMIEEAIDKVCAGEKHAFTSLITAYERQIYTYCYYILRSREEAEDAVGKEIFREISCSMARVCYADAGCLYSEPC